MKALNLFILSFVMAAPGLFGQHIVSEKPDFPDGIRKIEHCDDGKIWIPGEWSWDEDEESYVWKEGRCERGPRNHGYVPGYWEREADGWRWVEGSWEKISSNGIHRSRRP